MHENREAFRERLLAAETYSPALKAGYEKEVQAMFEKKLTGLAKLSWIAAAVGSIGFAILFGTVAITAPKGFPMLARLGFVVGAVFGVAFAVLALSIIKRGAVNLKKHPMAAAGLSWAFVVILVTLFMLLGSRAADRIVAVQMVLNGLVFLVMGALFMVRAWIERTELKTREKLLEIEYQLAEIAEALKTQRP